MFKWTYRSFVVVSGSVLASSYTAYRLKHNQTLRRNLYFWRKALPILFHYRFKELKFKYWNKNANEEEIEREFGVLHRKYSNRIYNIACDLRGFYVKVGQIAAQRLDTIPLLWAEKLCKLEDQLRCKDMEEISKVIEENFGRPLDAIFSQFDENPLGSASIGQVHKAVLRESNQTVAVKVLHRDAKGFFRADLATLEKFTKIAQKQLLPFVKQWRKLFEEEFDCRKEAQKMEEIGRNLEHWKRYVKVPRVFSDYCTEEVLVMEYLEGNKLSDSLSDIVRELRRMKDERSELSSYVKTRNRFAAVSSAAAVEKIESAVLTVIELLVKAINRMSFGFFKRNFLEEPHLVRINRLRKLVKTLVEVHGRTLFIDGIYNPDPHGGNVLILEDGKLGLIDYGQAARVDLDFRRKLASLLVAIDRGDWDNVEKYNAEIGFRTEKRSPKILRESARLFFGDGKTGKVAFPQYLESLFKGDPLLDYPADLFMAGKLAIILRGISLCLWGEVSMAHSWRPAAEEFLRKNQN